MADQTEATEGRAAADQEETIQSLRRAIDDMRLDHERAMADILRRLDQLTCRPVTVQVQHQPPLPRLRLFTGLPPASPQETTYEEWRAQAAVVVEDGSISDPMGLLRRSLRGVALLQTKSKTADSPQSLLEHFDGLFGTVKSAEDRYEDLCKLRQGRQQSAAELLTLQCGKLEAIRAKAGYNDREFQRRLYKLFARACTDVKLCREVRGKFGLPGEAAPAFTEVLRFVRKIEYLDGLKKQRTSHHHVLSASHVFVGQRHQDRRGQVSERPRRYKYYKRPRHCFNCGLEGHVYAKCFNHCDPALVAERDQEWRHRKGLPPLCPQSSGAKRKRRSRRGGQRHREETKDKRAKRKRRRRRQRRRRRRRGAPMSESGHLEDVPPEQTRKEPAARPVPRPRRGRPRPNAVAPETEDEVEDILPTIFDIKVGSRHHSLPVEEDPLESPRSAERNLQQVPEYQPEGNQEQMEGDENEVRIGVEPGEEQTEEAEAQEAERSVPPLRRSTRERRPVDRLTLSLPHNALGWKSISQVLQVLGENVGLTGVHDTEDKVLHV